MYSEIRKSEDGFSLVEIAVAVGLMSLLLIIAVPAFTGAIGASQNNAAKTALINAGIILENEKARNNGIYPSSTPLEISRNPEMSEITISYGIKRMSFCLSYPMESGGNFYYKSSSEAPFRSQVNECTTTVNSP
jgi:Tfp pilus assembly protein PilE